MSAWDYSDMRDRWEEGYDAYANAKEEHNGIKQQTHPKPYRPYQQDVPDEYGSIRLSDRADREAKQ